MKKCERFVLGKGGVDGTRKKGTEVGPGGQESVGQAREVKGGTRQEELDPSVTLTLPNQRRAAPA